MPTRAEVVELISIGLRRTDFQRDCGRIASTIVSNSVCVAAQRYQARPTRQEKEIDYQS